VTASPSAPEPLRLAVPGTAIRGDSLPDWLGAGPALRAAAAQEDSFLPARLVRVREAIALHPPLRDGEAGKEVVEVELHAGQVVLVELADGSSVILSPDALAPAFAGEAGEGGLPASRGLPAGGAAGVISRLFVLELDPDWLDPILREARDLALGWARRRLPRLVAERAWELAERGVCRFAMEALTTVIDRRLGVEPGLYRWEGGQRGAPVVSPQESPLAEAAGRPLLLLLHGIGSSCDGSFADLARSAPADWQRLIGAYGERVLAYEHPTFSVGPIANALDLVRRLPRRARLHLVAHSTGGLVGDLLGLGEVSPERIAAYWRRTPELERERDPRRRRRLIESLEELHAEQRRQLAELLRLLGEKELRVERYLRVAAPARGTRLVGAHLDVFLSALLGAIGAIPLLAASPIYGAVKRILLEMVRLRADPRLVPGLEALLPDSPLAALLTAVEPAASPRLAVVAGDREGDSLLRRLLLLLHDAAAFQGAKNDGVVDTDSMDAGIALFRPHDYLLRKGPAIHHFRYSADPPLCQAIVAWLQQPEAPAAFTAITPPAPPGPPAAAGAVSSVGMRGVPADGGGQPVLVLVPDLLGCELIEAATGTRLWFRPEPEVPLPPLGSWETDGLEPALIDSFYGDLRRHLERRRRVVPFAYDWRRPLLGPTGSAASRLAAVLRELLETATGPVQLLVHGAGVLLMQDLAVRDPELWRRLQESEGARVVLLGPGSRGSLSTLLSFLGLSRLVRLLVRQRGAPAVQAWLDQLARCPGLLQSLPALPLSGAADDLPCRDPGWWSAARLEQARARSGVAAAPDPDLLARFPPPDAAAALPDPAGESTGEPFLVAALGQAPLTPCGLRWDLGGPTLLGTERGDGVTSWEDSLAWGCPPAWLLPLAHAALPGDPSAFPVLEDLLEAGVTARVPRLDPAGSSLQERSCEEPAVLQPSAWELLGALLGGSGRSARPVEGECATVLRVRCLGMDVRSVSAPVLVGHYEQDAIAGPESLIDRWLVDGQLSLRHQLGIYAGPQGRATVVLLAPNAEERRRASFRGAVVIGLGPMGELTLPGLTEAVRTGTLQYLLQMLDRAAGEMPASGRFEVPLTTLLIGTNSTTVSGITIEDSLAGILRGVMAANRQFRDLHPHRSVCVGRLDVVELHLDSALTAVRALGGVAERLNREFAELGMRVEADSDLHTDGTYRHRLDAAASAGYWTRFVISEGADAATGEDPAGDGASGLARTLRFVRLGQLARATTSQQQRQPGLVERLVANAIDQPAYNPNLARALFHLLVPEAFKDPFRQADRMVLVLDERTADLPWEMVCEGEGETPLCVRQPMVRQLQSAGFERPGSRAPSDTAFVVGNPSTEGFAAVFRTAALPSLPAAEEEAVAVARLLRGSGWEVEESIGAGDRAVDIIEKLYRRPYRLVHIAAHGLFAAPTHAGDRRSGVVLSDGTLITAVEVCSLEQAPDLVFLSCCHLARVEGAAPEASAGVPYNRLAASLSRELIARGVRVVVAAGWAVADEAAGLFTATFYRELVANRPFGEAVHLARVRTFEAHPDSTTWGAFQAYGDPSFVLDPSPDQRRGPGTVEPPPPFVHPEELLQELRGLQVELHVPSLRRSGGEGGPLPTAERLRALLERARPPWPRLPAVAATIADVYREMGADHFEQARHWYRIALGRDPQGGDGDPHEAGAPLRAIERLADVESLLGLERWEQGREGGEELLTDAIRRLEGLHGLIGDGEEAEVPAVRLSFLAGAWLNRTVMLAQRLHEERACPPGAGPITRRFRQGLARTLALYRQAGDHSTAPLDALALQAIRALPSPPLPRDGERLRRDLATIRHSAEAARQSYRASAGFLAAVIPAYGLLVRHLLARSLPEARLAVETAYEEALEHVGASPADREAVVRRLGNLLHLAEGVLLLAARGSEGEPEPPALARSRQVSAALRELHELAGRITRQLRPGGSPQGEAENREAEDGEVVILTE
jgi:hypothetical protein